MQNKYIHQSRHDVRINGKCEKEWSFSSLCLLFPWFIRIVQNHVEWPFKIITYNWHLAQGSLNLLGLCFFQEKAIWTRDGQCTNISFRYSHCACVCVHMWVHFTHISVHSISYGIYMNNKHPTAAILYFTPTSAAELKHEKIALQANASLHISAMA